LITYVRQEFRHQTEAFGNRGLRLALMDEQGIQAALMYPASAHDIEFEFADNIDAGYANIRAWRDNLADFLRLPA
jgi:hypothetical protein